MFFLVFGARFLPFAFFLVFGPRFGWVLKVQMDTYPPSNVSKGCFCLGARFGWWVLKVGQQDVFDPFWGVGLECQKREAGILGFKVQL